MGKKRKQGKRGCGATLPLLLVTLGLASCGWGLSLAVFRGGEQVSATLGWTFWLGWACGISLFMFGLVLLVVQRVVGAASNAVDQTERGIKERTNPNDLLPDFIPNVSFLDDLFRR